ncbi:ABC transporter ATP-binding protein/permease [Leptolyngbya sp. DQ-M1]|uniref:ABC transporter ATP-binding protein n=1 Tax=Leptolyngbya sp. DQ-M1 TaxID=2933920 RepID=UPI00329A0317
MLKTLEPIRGLLPFLELYPWAIPTIVVLGILSSLSEGLGISLFIPLFESLQQPDSQGTSNSFLRFLTQVLGNVSPNQRFFLIALFIFGCILVKSCLTYGNAILFAWLDSRIGHQLRSKIHQQLMRVSYSFIESSESGRFMNTLGTETWQTSQALKVFVNLIIDICTVLVLVGFLLLISWQLTLIVSAVIGLISLSIQTITRRVKPYSYEAVEANKRLAGRMWESLGGMRVIRSFGRESYEQARFDAASGQVRDMFFKLAVLSGIVPPLSELLSATLVLFILVVAVNQAQTTLPTLLTFVFILYRLQPKIKQIDSACVSLLGLTSSIAEVSTLLDRSDKPYLQSGALPFPGLQQSISFRNVAFRYPAQTKPAVEDISIWIPPGKTTALVGPSGAGKSTLIHLLCRFCDPSEGEIYVNGTPLQKFNLNAWRDRLAIVSQDVFMFSSTIRENIAYGRLDATDDEIIAAAQLANAHNFILQLPYGYETEMGDRGMRLSGGQRQRIALARAIVRDPDILILDEATNALDSISEDLIQQALATLSQNRTVIVIAHRLSTIEQADQIIVMDHGRVVEQGDLQHLLQLNGLFTKMYQLQYRSA